MSSVASPAGSYTRRLLEDASLLSAKVVEEANELVDAVEPEHVTAKAADVLYFTLVTLAKRGVSLTDVMETLDRRARKVTRRPGNAKRTEVNV